MANPERIEGVPAARRVGIVGAGQLARMLCEAASAMGVDTVVLAEHHDDAAVRVAGDVIIGSPRDPVALASLVDACDVVTFDHELVDLGALRDLQARGHTVRPGPDALEVAVDKAVQRRRFSDLGIPVPRFVVLDGDDLDAAAAVRGFAAELGAAPVVKAARGGYDGRGVVVATTVDEAVAAATRWRADGVAVVLEAPVRFSAELAALLVRRASGDVVSWPAVETAQLDGVCREVRVPGGVSAATARAAAALATQVAQQIDAVGVLAVELFETDEGLLVNEVALRPHNSGHWTIEGATTSQFENHLRAVLDLPLGATDLAAPAICTVNVFGGTGHGSFDLDAALSDPHAKVHLYGKAPRPGRKLGHVTVLGTDATETAERAWRAAAALGTPRPVDIGASR